MSKSSRFKRAFRAAIPASIAVAIGNAFILFTHPKLQEDLLRGASIGIAMVAIVFITYFVLGFAGFRVSVGGQVRVPRLISWLVVAVATLAVFGLWFYFWAHHR
jgi:hypothetical protein